MSYDVGTIITGYTYSTNFPGAPPRIAANENDADVFVTKLGPGGEIVWSVVIGGSGLDYPAAIAPGTGGDIYVAGRTSSTNFPTTNALQSVPSANGNAFVLKLNSAGEVRYSTYLGGSGYDAATALAVTNSEAIVVGVTASADFPGSSGQQTNLLTATDVFVARLGAAGTNLTLSTFLRGSDQDTASAVAFDGVNGIYVAGSTRSLDFPVTAGAYRTEMTGLGGNGDVFVTKLAGTNGSPVYSTFLGIPTYSPVALAVGSEGSAYIAGAEQVQPLGGAAFRLGIPVPPPTVQWNSNAAFFVHLDPAGRLWAQRRYDTSGSDGFRTLTRHQSQNSLRCAGNLGEQLFQGGFADPPLHNISFSTFSACGEELNHLFAFPPEFGSFYHVAGFGPNAAGVPGAPAPSALVEARRRADVLVNAHTSWPGVGWGPTASLSFLNAYENRFSTNEVIYLRVDGGSAYIPQLTNISVFSGTNRIATFDGAPRLLALTNLPPGLYNLTAVARSSFDGGIGTSCPLSFIVFPAPRNDSFYRATHIDGTSYVTNATNEGASDEPTEPTTSFLYSARARRSVWWCWTAPVSGPFAIEITSDEISPQVGVYVGPNLSQLERVASAGPGLNVVSAFKATAGTHYFISVESAYSGDFVFRLRPAAPPSNDDHTNRIALTGTDFTISANNVDATREPDLLFDSVDSPASVWWRWTAPLSGQYLVSVTSSNFSPTLDIRNVTNPGVGMPGFGQSPISFTAAAGEEFDLRVAGMYGSMGNFTLSISNVVLPANDNFAAATVITSLPTSIPATTLGATIEPDEPGDATASVWYRWTAPTNVTLTVEINPPYAAAIQVYSGTALSNLTLVAGEFGSRTVTFHAESNKDYYLRLDDYSGGTLGFTLTVRQAGSPPNDNFANAIVLNGFPVSVHGSNREASLEPGEPSHFEDSIWYRWVAPSNGHYVLSVGGTYQLMVTPYTGTSMTNLSRATVASPAPDQNFATSLFANAGTEYYLAVSGYAGLGGPFGLRIRSATPPANDNFTDRIAISGLTVATNGSTVDASVESSEPLPDSFADKTVWWSWTAPESRKMVFWLSNVSQSFRIQVFNGMTLSGLSSVGSAVGFSAVIVDAQAAQTYAIQVSGRSQGTFTLNIAPVVQPPNDHFTNAFALTGYSAWVTGTGVGATLEPGEPPFGFSGYYSVWWNWTAPVSGRITLSSQASIAVYAGNSVSSLTRVSESSRYTGSGATFLAEAGTTYHIAVYSLSTEPFDLVLTAPALPPNPELVSMRRLGNGAFEFQFDSIMGQTNVIDASTDLINWVPIATNFLDCGVLNVLDPAAAGFPHRFYRLRKP